MSYFLIQIIFFIGAKLKPAILVKNKFPWVDELFKCYYTYYFENDIICDIHWLGICYLNKYAIRDILVIVNIFTGIKQY